MCGSKFMTCRRTPRAAGTSSAWREARGAAWREARGEDGGRGTCAAIDAVSMPRENIVFEAECRAIISPSPPYTMVTYE